MDRLKDINKLGIVIWQRNQPTLNKILQAFVVIRSFWTSHGNKWTNAEGTVFIGAMKNARNTRKD